MPSLPKTGSDVFSKSFTQGLIVVVLIYATVFGWVAVNADKTLHLYEGKFPSHLALVQREEQTTETSVLPAPAPLAPTETTPVETSPVPTETASEPEAEEIPATSHTGPLKPAPIEGLYEKTEAGLLPQISGAGLTPFNAYKRPFAPTKRPVIALAVKDYGLSAEDSDKALALPADVSFILSPYAKDPELWQKKAREAGHEVWLSLPMENMRFLEEDPGPLALLSHSSLPENQKKLAKVLGAATGYAGVVSETDKAFLDMHAMLSDLMRSVFARGLGYVELNVSASDFLETIAVGKSYPYTSVDKNNIKAPNFEAIESGAQLRGAYVATIVLTPKNLKDLNTWSIGLSSKGIAFAPLSALASGQVVRKPVPDAPPVSVPVPPAAEAAPPPAH